MFLYMQMFFFGPTTKGLPSTLYQKRLVISATLKNLHASILQSLMDHEVLLHKEIVAKLICFGAHMYG